MSILAHFWPVKDPPYLMSFITLISLRLAFKSWSPPPRISTSPLPKNDLKSWVGYRNGFKYPASSVTKPFSFTRANLIWLEPFLRFSPSLVGHFQMNTLKPSCDHNFTSRPDLVWSSSSASNSDDFPFFGSSIANIEPELHRFEYWSIFVGISPTQAPEAKPSPCGWNSSKYQPIFKPL